MSKAVRFIRGLGRKIISPHSIPLYYFSDVPNIGDLLSPYIVSRVSGRPVYRMQSGGIANLCAIGSVIGAAGPKTHVWGSGSLEGKPLSDRINPARIHALRGRKTLALARQKFDLPDDLPLGDPAVLTPRYFRPQPGKTHRYGIIPHLFDRDLIEGLLRQANGSAKLLDVRQEPEAFIAEMMSCEIVLSSSLHGLILADAYQIPNVWAVFSDRLHGGTFKFEDYYSTTDMPDNRPFYLHDINSRQDWFTEIEARANVSTYTQSPDALIAAFPEPFRAPDFEARQPGQGSK
jgi:pyruvyltransferase